MKKYILMGIEAKKKIYDNTISAKNWAAESQKLNVGADDLNIYTLAVKDTEEEIGNEYDKYNPFIMYDNVEALDYGEVDVPDDQAVSFKDEDWANAYMTKGQSLHVSRELPSQPALPWCDKKVSWDKLDFKKSYAGLFRLSAQYPATTQPGKRSLQPVMRIVKPFYKAGRKYGEDNDYKYGLKKWDMYIIQPWGIPSFSRERVRKNMIDARRYRILHPEDKGYSELREYRSDKPFINMTIKERRDLYDSGQYSVRCTSDDACFRTVNDTEANQKGKGDDWQMSK